jgi:probable F420-dependent oxidoreductase
VSGAEREAATWVIPLRAKFAVAEGMDRRPPEMTVSMMTDELRSRLGRVGIWMPPPERTGVDPAAIAAAIERAGFTSVWIGGGNATPDAFARLRPLLAGSSQLIVATGIANVWAWEPARMRTQAEDLAGEFPGRFILGLGVSHAPLVASLGHSYLRPLQKMEKFLDELDHPAQHGADRQLPPIVLAALGPKMLRLSRDHTLGAHPYFTTPEHTAFARSVLGPSPLLVPEQAVSLARDAAEGLAAGRAYGERYLRLPNYTRNLERFGFGAADFAAGGKWPADLGDHPVWGFDGARPRPGAPGCGRGPRADPAARRRRRLRGRRG